MPQIEATGCRFYKLEFFQMWICPRCTVENHDSLKACLNCGTTPDGTENSSVKIAERMPQYKNHSTAIWRVCFLLLLIMCGFLIGNINMIYFFCTAIGIGVGWIVSTLFAPNKSANNKTISKSKYISFVLADGDIFSKPANKSFIFAGGCYAFCLALAFYIVNSSNFLVVFISTTVGCFIGKLVGNYYEAVTMQNKPQSNEEGNTVADDSSQPPQSKCDILSTQAVGVPRRFSVGTLMIITALFGLLFAVMKMLGANPIIFGMFAVYFMGIGLAQMLLFKAKQPRKASIVGGFYLGLVIGLITVFVTVYAKNHMLLQSMDEYDNSFFCASMIMLLGGPFGYLAGGLTAGIFLVRERELIEEKENTFDAADEEES